MCKKSLKVMPFIIAVVLLVSTVVSATDATITGSTLNFTSSTEAIPTIQGADVPTFDSQISFGTVATIEAARAEFPSAADKDYIRIDDNRGTNAGWEVKLAATDLVATVADPTNITSETPTADVKIPINAVLKLIVGNKAAINNSILTNVTINSELTAVTNAGVAVMNAPRGSGAGAYSAEVDYTLSLSNYLPAGSTVTPSSSDSSTLDDATPTDLGLFAGDYSTTLTYAIQTAP